MDIKILLQAFNSPWMIHPESAQHYAIIAARLIAGENISLETEEDKKPEFAFIVNAAGKKIGSIQDAVDNGVAVINLKGAVMKYDYCGAAGTQSIIGAVQAANDNPAIAAIVLQIDSPGGAVDGTEQLSNAVKQSAKPVVAYVNGMMCSAAMWIGSAAAMRIASSKTDTIGSIGTMAGWNDYSGYMQRMGITQHEVYATNSTQKNLPFREAAGKNADGKTNYEPLIKTWLDPLNTVFQETIQENLPSADKSVLNGAAYIATTAKSKGLIDKIGTFQEAVNTALKLAQSNTKIQSQNTDMKYQKFLAFIGLSGVFSSTKDIQLDEAQADKIETALTENETLKGDLQTANDALSAMTAERDSLQASLNTANETIATLEKSDAVPTPAIPTGEQDVVAKEDPSALDFQQALFNKL